MAEDVLEVVRQRSNMRLAVAKAARYAMARRMRRLRKIGADGVQADDEKSQERARR